MSNTTRSRKSRRANVQDRSATTDVVTQLECAIRNPHAALIGAVIGGLVPWFGLTLAHDEIPAAWSAGNSALALAMIAVVLGCACFSGISVYKFGKAAFGDTRKALGFVLALEGVMLVSHGTTSTVALLVLILINAVANGSVIALSRDATCRQRDAARRASATRANSRARAEHAQPAAQAAYHAPVEIAAEAPKARAARPASRRAPSQALVPTWHPAAFDDVIDAEIVSAQKLFA